MHVSRHWMCPALTAVSVSCLRSPSSTRSATPKRTTRRSGRASVATTPSSESCLNLGPAESNSREGEEGTQRGLGGVGGGVGGVRMWSSLLITCSASDVRDETEIQNILKNKREKKKKERPDQTERLGELSWMFLFVFINFFFPFSFCLSSTRENASKAKTIKHLVLDLLSEGSDF